MKEKKHVPYQGLHKDPIRMIFVIGTFLVFLAVPIFYFLIVPLHFSTILFGVFVIIILIVWGGVTISLLMNEYKEFKKEKRKKIPHS